VSDIRHPSSDITQHPDAAEMRARYERLVARREAAALDGLVLLTGLYAAISPWVVHFRASSFDLAVNNLIIGIALAVLGLGMTTAGDRVYRLSWVCPIVGVWLIISPWVVPASHGAGAGVIWNNVVVGVVTCLLGLAALGMVMDTVTGRAAGATRTRRTRMFARR
jgi:hypothetical protein